MTDEEETRLYRKLIDELVHACREGQGRVVSQRHGLVLPEKRVRDARVESALVGQLSTGQREVFSLMLQGAFVAGVHSTLASLYARQVKPFDKAYEGSPFHDFIGRLDDWEWPSNEVEPRFE